MTTLNKGAESFAGANWANGIGFAAGAALNIGQRFARITGAIDQSAYNIDYLDINPGAQGIIGGPDDGELICDATTNATSRIRNAGRVELYVKAGGSGSKINNFHNGHTRARSRLRGGEFEYTSISAGALSATGDTTIDDLIVMGGKATIKDGSASAINELVMTGGVAHIQRKVTTIIVGAGATLDLDPADGVTWTSAIIKIYGGLVRWFGGELPSIEAYGGEIDFTVAREPLSSSLGTTKFEVAGTKIKSTPDIDLSNMVDLGAIYRSEQGLINGSGNGPIPAPD